MLSAYTLDRQDRIIAVSDGWDRFALDNDGPTACAAHVLGGRLVDAIDGDPVRMFMTAILMRVRASGQAEVIPYRCDSPTVKRFYTMTVRPLMQGAVRVEHFLDREEKAHVEIRVRPARPGQFGRLRCSICCRLKEEDGWRDPFDGDADCDLRVVHTVCEDCKRAPMRSFRSRGSSQPRPSG